MKLKKKKKIKTFYCRRRRKIGSVKQRVVSMATEEVAIIAF